MPNSSDYRPVPQAASDAELGVLNTLSRHGAELASTRQRISDLQSKVDETGSRGRTAGGGSWRPAIVGAGVVTIAMSLMTAAVLFMLFEERVQRKQEINRLTSSVESAVGELAAQATRDSAQLNTDMSRRIGRLELVVENEVTEMGSYFSKLITALSAQTDEGLGTVVQQLGRIEQRGASLETSYEDVRRHMGELASTAGAMVRLRAAFADVNDDAEPQGQGEAQVGAEGGGAIEDSAVAPDTPAAPTFEMRPFDDDVSVLALNSRITPFELADGTPLMLRSETLLRAIKGTRPIGLDSDGRYIFDVNDVEIAVAPAEVKMSTPGASE